jgi:hypothetical protein
LCAGSQFVIRDNYGRPANPLGDKHPESIDRCLYLSRHRGARIGTALIAAIVIGLVNATIGFVLKILTLPLTLLTFGLFWLVINALMLQLASYLVPGFSVSVFGRLFRRHRAQHREHDPALADHLGLE